MNSSSETPEGNAARTYLSEKSFEVERIFPIRNLFDEHTDDSGDEEETRTEVADLSPVEASSSDAPVSEFLPPPFPRVPSEDKLRKLPPTRSDSEYSSHSDGEGGRIKVRKVTERAQLVPAKNGGAPGSISVEAGKTTFHRCEDEPIHIPGAIQSYGALVALKYADDGDRDVLVRIASENTETVMGYTPEALFQLDSFCDILDASQRQDFMARMDYVLAAGHTTSSTDLDVFSLTLLTRARGLQHYWCGLHLSVGTSDTIICEVETQDDSFFPGAPGVNTLPAVPTSTTGNDAVEGERLKSITRRSQSIRALSLARARNTRLGYVEMFNSMSQVQSQLSATKTLQQALDVLVGIVQEMTHFHRVMVYQFDQDFNGEVVSELVDPLARLHFPASDIPKQAQDLYKINKIRILYDRDSETARLVCRDESDFERPLDLTHSYLRAMSPIHIKYLGHMGVRSSMSISIVINNELWGLVACHSYGDSGIRVPLPIRELCRNIGECASINIERLVMFSRLLARRPLEITEHPKNAPGFIAASSADLLNIFNADFGMLSIQDEARTIGKPAPYREALAILAYLQKKKLSNIVASQKVAIDFPDIKYAPGIHSIAGILVIPLSMLGNDFIVFFRLGYLKEVRWAGNPYEKITVAGTANYLEPRSSFRRWTEKVEGTSKEWTDDQLETASILSLLYGRFIEVWRQKELAIQRSRMTRLLLRNSSHEVRTPLNAIINYLEIALENNLDENTREIIEKAHKSSRSLVYVIDDLLNLTKAEDGSVFAPAEKFELVAIVHDIVSTFKKEGLRRGLELSNFAHPGLPTMVKGDPTRLRQVLSNVISNAFQNTASGGVKIDTRPVKVKEDECVIAITIQDLGTGMSEKQLDDLFQDFEQILDEEEEERSPRTPADKPSLGVGLAVVARYVRNMNGQIRVKSEPGKGTIFTIELPFERVIGSPLIDSNVPYSSGQISSSTGFTFGSMASGQVDMSPSVTDASSTEEDPFPSSGSPDTVVPAGELALDNFKFPSFASPPTRSANLTLQQKRAASQHSSSSSLVPATYPFPNMEIQGLDGTRRKLKILIAEDNPINARMLKKRLEKTGHEVYVVDDGQSCFDSFEQTVERFDAILMDLQMPLLDGHASTRMIRKLEREREVSGTAAATAATRHSRIPIFAVSASLTEAQRFEYAQDGFDGWVLKPIDYNRLEMLMHGVYTFETRRQSIYTPGEWESGGWFMC